MKVNPHCNDDYIQVQSGFNAAGGLGLFFSFPEVSLLLYETVQLLYLKNHMRNRNYRKQL